MFLVPQRPHSDIDFVADNLEREMEEFAVLEVVNSGATDQSGRGKAKGLPRKRNRRKLNSDEESSSDHDEDSEEEK